jgi:hypothetical protein
VAEIPLSGDFGSKLIESIVIILVLLTFFLAFFSGKIPGITYVVHTSRRSIGAL